MLFRASLVVILAVELVACGSGPSESCGKSSSSRSVRIKKDAKMSDSESEMPLCVCSFHSVNTYGWTKTLADADVEVTVTLVSNQEFTPIEVDPSTVGTNWSWDDYIRLKTKGHGALAYSFSLLITYNFPSVGSEQDDIAELRRLVSELTCVGKYYTFTNEPCSNI